MNFYNYKKNKMKQIVSSLLAILITFLCACNSAPDPRAVNANVQLDEAAETEAIMKVIEEETNCFFQGDYECWAKYWSHEDYVFQAWNNSDGTADVARG